MELHHVAVWTNKLEELKDFYVKFFDGKVGEKYVNPKKHFESYFVSFENGSKLELMSIINLSQKSEMIKLISGLTHIAFSVENKEKVDELTDNLRNCGCKINSEPRVTGDGYYESSFFDIDDNLVEIVAKP